MPRAGSTANGLTPRRRRPDGLAPGIGYLVFAWVAVFGLAALTGSVAVVVLLAATLIGSGPSLLTGWWALRGAMAVRLTLPGETVVGEPTPLRIEVVDRRGRRFDRTAHVRIDRPRGPMSQPPETIGSGWLDRGELDTVVVFARRGEVSSLSVTLIAAGGPGLVWWRRRIDACVEPVVVAPRPAGPGAHVEPVAAGTSAESATTTARRDPSGEIDGLRQWREGDSDRGVHWPTSMRTGELSIIDHRSTDAQALLVVPHWGPPDPEVEAGRIRWALDDGRRRGCSMWLATPGGGAVPVPDGTVALRLAATCDLGPEPPLRRTPLLQRPMHLWREPDRALAPRARWAVALASAIALHMLSNAVAFTPGASLALIGGCALGAALTARREQARWLRWATRAIALIVAAVGLTAVFQALAAIADLRSVIQGPLPLLLMVLVVLQGFECTDRRAGRVALAVAAVVVAQAVALRVDDAAVWWLGAWALVWSLGMSSVGRPAPSARGTRRLPPLRRSVGVAATTGLAAAATVALLGAVEVPDGPADLALPAAMETVRLVQQAQSFARPDGSTGTAGPLDDPTRALGAVGGYPGFDASMDTSMRGTLGDEVVMRVRAPAPDFWRGQTFTRFDGRVWHTDPADSGVLRTERDVRLGPALGDVPQPIGVEVDELVQTYHLTVDHPNVVFAASRPVRVLIDAAVRVRADGSMRTDTVMTAGSVYTVVSQRAKVTSDALRRQGDVAALLPDEPSGPLADHLAVPPSTTERTRQLAARLSEGSPSTYDTIRRIEAWLAANVQYDLDAPIPAPGTDAVDDLLFGSQLGFCEQISSATAILLRTIGVPTRVATGYVSGARDAITGVWEVRASDAHAWVEVWFPTTGWQAFDPTAAVPLAGEYERATVGGEIGRATADAMREHGATIARAVAGALALLGLGRLIIPRVLAARRRRRRGRWGVLQDRWLAEAAARGLAPNGTNPALARQWLERQSDGHPTAPAATTATAPPGTAATELADLLDRAAFDPTFSDDDDAFLRAAALAEQVLGRH